MKLPMLAALLGCLAAGLGALGAKPSGKGYHYVVRFDQQDRLQDSAEADSMAARDKRGAAVGASSYYQQFQDYYDDGQAAGYDAGHAASYADHGYGYANDAVQQVQVQQLQLQQVHAVPQQTVHTEVTKEVAVPHPVPVPHAVPVPVPQTIIKHVPVAVAVPVPVPQPYAVHVPVHVVKTVAVPVEKPVPFAVEKPVPYPVEKPYPVTVEKRVPFAVPQPYPVHVPVYKIIYKEAPPKIYSHPPHHFHHPHLDSHPHPHPHYPHDDD
ncbi:MAGE-like protein 2 [Thrips palmi]|uniref:MAGE-like protein 2 n=1 Tax=Thrips palmi TaxID=161013 RepID=A0A6P8ZI77_THRPL|nr:MAGE-like protein 2 [Thrips palmi]